MRIVRPNELDLAAHAVEAGDLVVIPTRRWYMLCCDAANAGACARVFAAKRRPADRSLLLVASSAEVVQQLLCLSEDAELLAEAFWPGDLALLLPWRDPTDGQRYAAVGTPALVTRAPGLLGELANRTACPIAATSANISGTDGPGPSISLAEVREFVEAAGADIPIVVDGGVCPIANHLTIVSCTNDRAELVREGVLHARAVAAVLRRDRTG
jgi:L-threonylcarbamoyladenylate synthase